MSFNIGKALGSATNLLSSLSGGGQAGGVADILGGGQGGGLGAVLGSAGEQSKSDSAGGLGGFLGNALETVAGFGQFGVGGMVNSGLDALGLPDWLGDIAGGIVDFATGNFVGAAANGLDALGDGIKFVGKLSNQIGESGVEGYMELGGKVSGMYDDASRLASDAVEHAGEGAKAAVDSIDHARDAARRFAQGDPVSAGGAALSQLAESIGHDALLFGEEAGEVASTVSARVDEFATSFELLEGADSLDAGLERIREDLGEPAAELAKQFVDDARAGVDFGEAASRMYDRIADGVAGDLDESGEAAIRHILDSHGELAGAIAAGNDKAIEAFYDLFQSEEASGTAGEFASKSGSEMRM